MRLTVEEGELPMLDARLRRVGGLLVGYTVVMALVTLAMPERRERGEAAPTDAVVQLFVGRSAATAGVP